MTCEECLLALETESLREMAVDSPVMQHCASCPDCARVTTMLRDREYETATILNSLPPMSNPLTVAAAAVSTAQRRRVGQFVVMISGLVGAAIIWIVAATMIIPALTRGDLMNAERRAAAASGGLRTETMQLSCLSPQQAGDIIQPYLHSRSSLYFAPTSGIAAITVRGTPDELAKARNLIMEFENAPSAACRAPFTIVQKLREEMEKREAQAGSTPSPSPVKGPTTLLGRQGGSLLDPPTPRGTGPTLPPDKATTPPKKP